MKGHYRNVNRKESLNGSHPGDPTGLGDIAQVFSDSVASSTLGLADVMKTTSGALNAVEV